MITFNISLLWYSEVALSAYIAIQIYQTAVLALVGPLSRIPGPVVCRWTHAPLAWARIRRRQLHFIHTMHQEYGPVVRVSPGIISFASPESLKTIHKIGTEFIKAPFYEQLQLKGTLVSLTDIKQHTARRKYFAKAFSLSSLLEWEDMIMSHVEGTMRGIKEAGKGGKEVDVMGFFPSLATGIVAELVLGGGDTTSKEKIVQDIQKELVVPGSENAQRIPWYFQGLPQSITRRIMHFSARPANKLSLERLQVAASNPERHTLLTNAFAKADRLPDDVIVSEAKAFIVAGTDTTANTATYLIYQILRHSSVTQRLKTDLLSLPPNFSISDVMGLNYLHCVLNETLRLNGAVSSSLPRVTPQGGRDVGGYYIPGGTAVSTQAWTMHRDPIIFPDPLAFRPARWEEPTQEMKGAFMPFGIGSRGCIGMQLAQIELLLIAALFLREFPDARVGKGVKEGDMVEDDLFVLSPRGHKLLVALNFDQQEG